MMNIIWGRTQTRNYQHTNVQAVLVKQFWSVENIQHRNGSRVDGQSKIVPRLAAALSTCVERK